MVERRHSVWVTVVGAAVVFVTGCSASDASGDATVAESTVEVTATDDVDRIVSVATDAVTPGATVVPGVEVETGVQPDGFTTVTARITDADGEVCEVCLWLADDSAERARGLMDVTDLGDPVGMAFVWDEPADGRFFMFQTPSPLSIAWFDPAGNLLSTAEMDPCVVDDSSVCERYGTTGEYTVAVEMFAGQLPTVGIGPGARIELVDGSESPTCRLA